MKNILFTTIAAAALILGNSHAAEKYPNRAVTLVVPNAAGGPTDAIARALAQRLSVKLVTPVIIDNRGGAGGALGAESVARAKPDGYTLFFSTTGTLAINGAVYGNKLRYDPVKSFDPVALIGTTRLVLSVRKGFEAKNIKELISLAKQKPDSFSYGSSGVGSATHLATEYLLHKTGIRILHVPYKASTPATMDLREGRIDMLFAAESSAQKDAVETAGASPLLVSGSSRSPLFPKVQTSDEAGIHGFDVGIWYGINAPAGTPSDITELLNKEVVSILSSPDMRKVLDAEAVAPSSMSVAEFKTFLAGERKKWEIIVKDTGVTAE